MNDISRVPNEKGTSNWSFTALFTLYDLILPSYTNTSHDDRRWSKQFVYVKRMRSGNAETYTCVYNQWAAFQNQTFPNTYPPRYLISIVNLYLSIINPTEHIYNYYHIVAKLPVGQAHNHKIRIGSNKAPK